MAVDSTIGRLHGSAALATLRLDRYPDQSRMRVL
jgi:hypothetical protein